MDCWVVGWRRGIPTGNHVMGYPQNQGRFRPRAAVGEGEDARGRVLGRRAVPGLRSSHGPQMRGGCNHLNFTLKILKS